MMLFVLVLLSLLGPSDTATYAEKLNLTCPTGYTIEQPELKKTKVWKGCHDNAGGLSGCIEKGYKVSDVSQLLDRDKELCAYVNSRDHLVRYTGLIEKGEGAALKRYQKSPDYMAFLEDLKATFVQVTAEHRSEVRLEQMNADHVINMARVHEVAHAAVMGMFEELIQETERCREKVKKKGYNVLMEYESMELDDEYNIPALHMGTAWPGVPKWTTKPATRTSSTPSNGILFGNTPSPVWSGKRNY